MSESKFSCRIESTNPTIHLGFAVRLDDQVMFDTDFLSSPTDIEFTIDENQSSHTLNFCLHNKLPEHTILDSDGNIISDVEILISDIKFDEIDCTKLVYNLSEYHHDYNGSKPAIVDKFYGSMGCNGTVILKFYSPTYIWFLEHL